MTTKHCFSCPHYLSVAEGINEHQHTCDGVKFSGKEWQMLLFLAKHVNSFCPRSAIFNELYGDDPEGGPLTDTIKTMRNRMKHSLESTRYYINVQKHSYGLFAR